MKFKFILIFLLMNQSLISQDLNEKGYNYELGAGFDYQILFHDGAFKKLNEIPNCCPDFTKGDGTGYLPFIFFNTTKFYDFHGQLRLRYSMFNANFQSTEQALFSDQEELINGEFEHILDADFTSIDLQPMLSYNVFENLNVNLGLNIGYLLSGKFSQIEKITNPSNRGTFLDENGNDTYKRERNKYDGDIPLLNTWQLAGVAGISYDLPLNKNKSLWLSPEIYYSYGLTDVADQTPWKMNSFYAGISLKYMSNIKIEPTYPDEKIEGTEIQLSGNLSDNYYGVFELPNRKPEIKEVYLTASIKAVGVINDKEYNEAIFIIEEFLSSYMKPLLNYIFFENNISSLDKKYKLLSKNGINTFNISSLSNLSTLETYYNILNILAFRMIENPNEKITLVGCNSGKGLESNNIELSKLRAKAVKEYLTDNWGIEPDRIAIEAKNLPEKFSNPDKLDGDEENRRVEIQSNSWKLMMPVVTQDTIRTSNPPLIRFYTNVKSDNSISKWKITAIQGGEVLKTLRGEGQVPDTVNWYIDKELETLPKYSEPIEYFLEIADVEENKVLSSTGQLSVNQVTIQSKKEKRISDKRIDKYSLILFDYASSDVSGFNSRIVDYIKSDINSKSQLSISGYTDRTGTHEFNYKLSLERSEKVAKSISRIDSKIIGFGETIPIYNNDLPEGRFYCRTVEIDAVTPINW
jgi:outer membrane protein OmpA-like peptidoglycan-associated protein